MWGLNVKAQVIAPLRLSRQLIVCIVDQYQFHYFCRSPSPFQRYLKCNNSIFARDA